jgi:hypothetical protein
MKEKTFEKMKVCGLKNRFRRFFNPQTFISKPMEIERMQEMLYYGFKIVMVVPLLSPVISWLATGL